MNIHITISTLIETCILYNIENTLIKEVQHYGNPQKVHLIPILNMKESLQISKQL